MKLVLVLLCAGFVHFTFASNRLRIFNANSTRNNQTDTLNKCKNTNGSLVTLYDDDDADFTEKLFKSVNPDEFQAWLGLHRNRSTTWSDNNTVIFQNFTKDVTNLTQKCIAIVNETWTDFNCSDKKPFMCYRGTNYTLIENESLTWCQALQYCRNHFNDLVSISNEEQNQAVIEKGNSKTFWIGLMFDEWKWEDNGCSSYREWHGENDEKKKCTYYMDNIPPMGPYECWNVKNLFCSRGYVRIKVIQLNKTWEDALEYCEKNHSRLLWIRDSQDQEAVTQWLNTTKADGPFWIALRQSRVFGFWIWSNRTVTYHNWKNGSAPEMPFSQHCGVIETDDFKWRDENCSSERHFLCEEDIIYM